MDFKGLILSIGLPVAVMAIGSTCMAQDIYAPALQTIAEHSSRIRAARAECEAAVAESRTGLTPEDPEVGFDYLWGIDSDARTDVSVSQSFDFPTLYARRRALASAQRDVAFRGLDNETRSLMLEAMTALVDAVGCNAQVEICRSRLDNADKAVSAMERLVQTGQATRLELNKARINRAGAWESLERALLEKEKAAAALAALNGGESLGFDYSVFPDVAMPLDFDAWINGEGGMSPLLDALEAEGAVATQELRVARAEGLPKLSVGYMSEYQGGGSLQGVSVGVSLPLWQNRNAVKAAQARRVAADERLYDARLTRLSQLRALYDEASSLRRIELEYARLAKESDNTALLAKALNEGEMSLHDYLDECTQAFDVAERLLSIRRDYQLALAKLIYAP